MITELIALLMTFSIYIDIYESVYAAQKLFTLIKLEKIK